MRKAYTILSTIIALAILFVILGFSFWPSLVDQILVYLILYKYIAIFLVSFLAALIVPIPSGSVLMTAAAFSSIGYFNVGIVYIVSILGNILGDNLSYFLARSYGVGALSRIGFHHILASKKFNYVDDMFKRHRGLAIFFSRFEVLSTLSVNLLSGLARVPYRIFIFYEVLGTIAQVSLYTFIGYFFWDQWQQSDTVLDKLIIVGFVFIVFILVLFIRKLFKKSNHQIV